MVCHASYEGAGQGGILREYFRVVGRETVLIRLRRRNSGTGSTIRHGIPWDESSEGRSTQD
jgi:hypothetical protein